MGRQAKSRLSSLLLYIAGLLSGHLIITFYHQLPATESKDDGQTSAKQVLKESEIPRKLPLFIGVMTANKYLNTRGCSAWRSWANQMHREGKAAVRFFVGASDSPSPTLTCDLPVVTLKGVNDEDYPPQVKSFAMFRWMEENYSNCSLWFMRADDDVFIEVDKVLKFLSQMDPLDHHFLGQAGRGRGEEEGHLSLHWNQNFCMGGTGMILSRPTLSALVPRIPTCLANLVTSHEDVEVGRCVSLATGRTCTWAYQMQALFHHSAGGADDRGQEVQPDSLDLDVVNRAMTIHPVKRPANMEGLALRFKAARRLRALTQQRQIEYDIRLLGEQRTRTKIDEGEGTDKQSTTLPLDDLSYSNGTWDFIYGHSLYSAGPGRAEKAKVPDRLNRAIGKIVAAVVDKINGDSREKGRIIEFRDLYYAYVRNDPVAGNSYVLDILLVYKKFAGKKMTVKVRRHVFAKEIIVEQHHNQILPAVSADPSPEPAVVVPGDDGAINILNTAASDRSITLLLTVAGNNKISALHRFMADYEREVLARLVPARLVVVVFQESRHDIRLPDLVRQQAEYFDREYPGCSVTVILRQGKFSRGQGLTAGLAACQTSDLVFVLDVDISFKAAALANAHRFAAEGRSVYFPIVLSEFKDGDGGFWRRFGYGILAGFKSDIVAAGGYATDIAGWGKEDVDLFDKLARTGRLALVRVRDPNLVHKYHPVTCSSSLATAQAFMCAASRANVFLSLKSLFGMATNSTYFNF